NFQKSGSWSAWQSRGTKVLLRSKDFTSLQLRNLWKVSIASVSLGRALLNTWSWALLLLGQSFVFMFSSCVCEAKGERQDGCGQSQFCLVLDNWRSIGQREN